MESSGQARACGGLPGVVLAVVAGGVLAVLAVMADDISALFRDV